MSNRISALILVTAFVMLPGCKKDEETSTQLPLQSPMDAQAPDQEEPVQPLGPPVVVFGGVQFDFPWVVDPIAAAQAAKQSADVLRTTNGTLNFTFDHGLLRLNGKEYGTAKKGQMVKLTPNGRILVDGVERRPEDGSAPSQPATRPVTE